MNKFSAIFLSLIWVETFWLRKCMSNCKEIWGISSFLRFCFNLFHAIDLFLYPVKISKNLRGYRKRYVVRNRWIACSAINCFPDGNLNLGSHPAGNYMFKVNNRNIRTRCEIRSYHPYSLYHPYSTVSIVNFEQVNACWDVIQRYSNSLFMSEQPVLWILESKTTKVNKYSSTIHFQSKMYNRI